MTQFRHVLLLWQQKLSYLFKVLMIKIRCYSVDNNLLISRELHHANFLLRPLNVFITQYVLRKNSHVLNGIKLQLMELSDLLDNLLQ